MNTIVFKERVQLSLIQLNLTIPSEGTSDFYQSDNPTASLKVFRCNSILQTGLLSIYDAVKIIVCLSSSINWVVLVRI